MEFTYFEFMFRGRWPMLLFALTGIVVAILLRKRHPKVSWLTALGLLLFIAQSLSFATVFYLLPRLHERGFSYGSLNNLYLLVAFCRDIFYSGVIALLVGAVLSQRSAKQIVLPPKPQY